MKVGEDGQVAIPEEIRQAFGLDADTDVEFRIIDENIVLTKVPKHFDIDKWKGHCKDRFAELGYASVDEFIEDVRGR